MGLRDREDDQGTVEEKKDFGGRGDGDDQGEDWEGTEPEGEAEVGERIG